MSTFFWAAQGGKLKEYSDFRKVRRSLSLAAPSVRNVKG